MRGRKDMKALVIVAVLYFVIAPVHAVAGFEPKWEYEAPREIVSVGAMDYISAYYCSGHVNGLIFATFDKVYFINSTGEMFGRYNSEHPVLVVSPFVIGESGVTQCYTLAGTTNGVYSLRITNSKYIDMNSTMAHRWFRKIDDRIVETLATGDFEGSKRGGADHILIGAGSNIDVTTGYLSMMDNMNSPDKIWNKSYTGGPVKAITTLDLNADNIKDDMAIGYGTTVDVYHVKNKNVTSIWQFNSSSQIKSVVAADFDRDSVEDDLLIGAGSKAYAVTSQQTPLWNYDFGDDIKSITAVDIDNDKVIDHYLVATGTLLSALENSDTGSNVLWSYDTGYNIKKHVSLDFDTDRALDDVAIISGNTLFTYDYVGEVIAPKLSIEKTANKEKSTVGGIIDVTITVKNVGNEKAHEVRIADEIPKGLEVVGGEGLSIIFTTPELEVGDTAEFTYSLNATATGNYSLPRTEVKFIGSKGHFLRGASNSLDIKVVKDLASEVEGSEDSQPEAVGEPFVSVMRSVDNENVTAGENITVDTVVRNTGDGLAMTVNYEEELPEGFDVVEGDISWSGSLEPGATVINTYIIRAPESDEKTARYNLTELTLIYRTETGATLTASADPIVLTVITTGINLGLLLIPVLIAAAAGVVFVLHKTGKIDLSKVSTIKAKIFKKKVKTPMELENEFLAIYKEFQKKDQKPTYKDIKKKMKISTEEIDTLVDKLKKKLQIE